MTDNDNDYDMPRLVRVPIAGYIDVEIDPTIEVKNSLGWDSATEFERAAVEAASEALGTWHDNMREAKVRPPSEIEWSLDAHHALVRGNGLLVEQNEIDDLGVE